MKKKLNNLRYYYWFYGVRSLLFYVPVLVVYLTDILKNPFQVGVALTVKSVSVFLLEIPLGYLGDKFGRKKNLLLSIVVNILSLVLLILSPTFFTVIISEILFSISETLFSGADIALIYDNFKFEDRTSYFGEFQRNSSLINSIILALSFFIGSIIYPYSKISVFILAIISSIILLLILSLIKEHPYKENTHSKNIDSIKRDLIKLKKESFILKNSLFYSAFLVSIFMAIYFYIFPIELNKLNFSSNNLIYGLIYSLGVILIGLGGKFQKHISNTYTFVYSAGLYLIPLMLLTSLLKNRILLIFFILSMRFLWGVYSTNNSIILNHELSDSSIRATIFSIKNALLNSFLGLSFLSMGLNEKFGFSNFSFIYVYILVILLLFIGNRYFVKKNNSNV